jgi:hypothetical protein
VTITNSIPTFDYPDGTSFTLEDSDILTISASDPDGGIVNIKIISPNPPNFVRSLGSKLEIDSIN